MPQATIRSATSCAATAGVAMTPIATSVLADDLLEVVEGADVEPGDLLAVPVGVGVEQRDDPEAAASGSRSSWPARDPRLPMPTMTTGQSWVTPISRAIW